MTTHETTIHYSQEVSLFEGFLDPYMKYSSGWFDPPDEPLDSAIVRMLDKIVDLSGVRPGARVLEIGNGWGSLLRRLRERVPDLDYTGVNPSSVQLDYVARHVDRGARTVNQPFEAVMHELDGPYDAIFLIGALCHQKDKLAVTKRVAELLAEGGRAVIEDTFFLSEALYQAHAARQETKYVQDKVFGYAHVHSLARHHDDLRASGLRLRSAEDNTDHYARTIEIWTDRLKTMDAARYPLVPHFVAYMDVFQRGWNHTICNQLQVVERLPARRRAQVPVPA